MSSPLDRLRIAAPCPMSWDAMKGDDRRRFCDACKLHVYDLSNMKEQEALDLLARGEGRTCVRLWRRKDGTVITADCPVGIADRARRRLSTLATSAVVLLLTVIGGAAFARTDTGRRIVDRVSALLNPPADPVPTVPGRSMTMGLPEPPQTQK